MRPGLGRPWLVGATVVAVVAGLAGLAAGAYLVLRPGVETVAVFPPITPTQTGTADPEPDGTTTVWRWAPLDIGEDAPFLAGQRYAGDRGTHGHHRGVLMRQGRTVLRYVDFGQATTIADRSEVGNHERAARSMAAKIASASWT